ncbi:hypothetical protein P43SY_000411 [Pythium insidiosum]|uniref:Palmitoyl-protein thioesterase 1 n=1 Tax=Pythium insidiosum TaxID=114742 RepID=A0AAD5Q4A6_PYTIN|nr:hypothetical protein P43SY_000411 [Pythium insidiosum]
MNTPTKMVVALSAVVTVAMFALQLAMYGWVVTEYIVVAQALPQCKPTQFICKEINHLIGEAVYSDQVQSKFLPDINNERSPPNATYKANFVKLRSLVLVRAKKDTQVFPKDSEWFGGFRDGTYEDILGFNETRWYKEDLFGLQTLHNSGKIHFLETDGNHLQFSTHFLLDVVDKYFMTTLA